MVTIYKITFYAGYLGTKANTDRNNGGLLKFKKNSTLMAGAKVILIQCH